MKRTLMFIGSMVLIAASAGSSVAVAQDRPLVPLKVQLVVSRYAADKKISSLPYTLWVTANDKRTTNVRMGVQVPIAMTATGKEGVTSTPSYQYRDVGTSIDCQVNGPADGLFSLDLRLSDSSVSFDPKDSGQSVKGVPAFRNFTSNFNIMVKEGQTAQYASATDPVSGETLKVDVTVNVLK